MEKRKLTPIFHLYICFYSNLFGIVQQTTKRSKIAVPNFQFVAVNAVPKFQLGAANAVPNFQFVALKCSAKISTWCCKCSAKFSIWRCKCSAKFSNCQFVAANAVPTCSEKYKCFVVAISFCHRFYSGCKIYIILKICQQDNLPFLLNMRDFTVNGIAILICFKIIQFH